MATRRVSASIFLRSVSGRSVHELLKGTPPADLSPYLPPLAARDEVFRFFERCGFEVFLDDTGPAVHIEGASSLFAKVFGVAQQSLVDIPASKTKSLKIPAEVGQLVEEIVLVPEPEMLS